MVGNIHSLGASLREQLREHISNHTVTIRYLDNLVLEETDPINGVSSAPIGQFLQRATGLDLATQFRTFFFPREVFAEPPSGIGLPQLNWIIIDQADGTSWRIIADEDEYAWQYHGQLKTSIKVTTKAESSA